ncbi:hypothetical protein SBBP2_1590004 [Burkholderiales bacterium]|nr:hypothetical protein SBBP2_1590004 [Burkholderiales bacterium]
MLTVKDLPVFEELDASEMSAVSGGSRIASDGGGSLATPGAADIAVANGADPVAAYGSAAASTWYETFGFLLPK